MRLPLALRRATSVFLRPIKTRIQAGPNQGARWSLAAAGRHRTGRFEWKRVGAIQALLDEGDCFWDVGAHHGYVTLVASRLVGPAGFVYAFEPSSFNRSFLVRHVRWNTVANVEVLPLALAGQSGQASFGGHGSTQAFRIGGGSERVETRSIEALLKDGLREPDFIKLDIEGAEAEVLRAGAAHLPDRAVLLIAIHSAASYDACAEALRERGFDLIDSVMLSRMRASGAWRGDPDLLAIGPARTDTARRARGLAYFGGG